jgi:hypothetical protein
VADLKTELNIAGDSAAWVDSHADIEAILGTATHAKQTYDDLPKDHTGTRAWLERCSTRVMYYGKIFDNLAQHHPEYTALAWGAIKLVLMVC